MAAEIVAIGIDRSDTTRIERQAYGLIGDLLAVLEGREGRAALKGHRAA